MIDSADLSHISRSSPMLESLCIVASMLESLCIVVSYGLLDNICVNGHRNLHSIVLYVLPGNCLLMIQLLSTVLSYGILTVTLRYSKDWPCTKSEAVGLSGARDPHLLIKYVLMFYL